MAKGKRAKRATVRGMAVDPELFDLSVWQRPEGAEKPDSPKEAPPPREPSDD